MKDIIGSNLWVCGGVLVGKDMGFKECFLRKSLKDRKCVCEKDIVLDVNV